MSLRPAALSLTVTLILAGAVGLGPAYAQRTMRILSAGIQPRISWDGRTVALGATLIRPDGSPLRTLPISVAWAGTNLSGDGRLIAYHTYAPAPPYPDEIHLFDVQTMTDLNLSAGLTGRVLLPDISADGSTVVFMREWDNLDLYAVNPDGTNLRMICCSVLSTGAPTISADGALVAFDGWRDIGSDIGNNIYRYRAGSDGTGPTRLTVDPNRLDYLAKISDDGGKIAFQSEPRGFFVVDGDGSRVTQLSNLSVWGYQEGRDFSGISGDGRVAVFSDGRSVFSVRTDGTGLRQIGNGKEVAVSGRGDIVIFTGSYEIGWGLWAAGVPGIAPGELDDLSFDADGRTLGWATSPAANSHNLYRGELASSGPSTPASCLQGSITASTALDPDLPAPSLGFFYLVTGENGSGEGTLGFTSGGVERTAGASCPPADTDGDGVLDSNDACPLTADPLQEDQDGDGVGDACDNCPIGFNPDQTDEYADGLGDYCECLVVYNPGSTDADGDGLADTCDTCPTTYNPTQAYVVNPVVQVIAPNGGERLTVGQTATIQWSASDECGGVSLVDIYVSRTGIEGPYERIAVGLSNLGAYSWVVTGPPSTPWGGFIRVVARDPSGDSGQDQSDGGFRIQ